MTNNDFDPLAELAAEDFANDADAVLLTIDDDAEWNEDLI